MTFAGKTALPDTEIEAFEHVECGSVETEDYGLLTGLPEFYRVRLISRPGTGSYIRSEVWLPDKWNERLVGLGTGGMAGHICYRELADYMMRGYACVNTDMGTSRGQLSGFRNPDVIRDFGWRSTHLMTVCAKLLIRDCYGKDPVYSYFVGLSTGGQQAFSEAQRFPDDYDGIYSGVPAFNRTALHTYFVWNFNKLRDKDGSQIITSDEFVRIRAIAVEYFQSRGDGEPGDVFVSYPWHGTDTPECFVAYLCEKMPELSQRKAEILKALYTGPSDPVTGEQIYCGIPIGSEVNYGSFGDFPAGKCTNFYPFLWTFGPDYTPADCDFSADIDELNRTLAADMNANDPDLSAFRNRGGKLLSYSGSEDPIVPYPESFSYYERAAEAAGGTDECLSFFRYFLLPGRSHNAGFGADEPYCENPADGTAFDALVRWCEKGIAPDCLTAISRENPKYPGKKNLERKVYPYGSSKFPFCEYPTPCSERFRK